MNITRHDLWAMPIWQFDLELDLPLIEQECYTYEQVRAGKPQTNYDWRDSTPYSGIKSMLDSIEQLSSIWYKDMGVKDRYSGKIENFWVNINGPGRFNKAHLHPDSIFTGVYYARSLPGAGNIVFHNAPDREFALQTYTDKPTPLTITNPNFEPKLGRVYIFPSWLSHSVDSNMSGTDRISISFHFN